MNGNVGASFALSFLLVGVVAVVLYPSATHPPNPAGNAPVEVSATPEPAAQEPLPPLTPAIPWSDAQAPTEPSAPSPSLRPDPATSPTARSPDDPPIDRDRRPSVATHHDRPADVP